MPSHSSTLAQKIPWMEEPGGLQSMGLPGVGGNSVTSLSLFTFMQQRRKWQPTPVFLPGEFQGRQSLVGCCLWGRTESDTTEVTQQQQQQYDPAIPLLGIYLEKACSKGYIHPMFIATLFTIAKTQKQPIYPLTVEWTKKVWYTYTMEYYSAIKNNEIKCHLQQHRWTEIVILSEGSQTEKNIM